MESTTSPSSSPLLQSRLHKSNGNGNYSSPSNLRMTADLIQSIDRELKEKSAGATDAARNAEIARRNAREASEVARRYTARSYCSDFSPQTTRTRQEEEEKTTTSRMNGGSQSDGVNVNENHGGNVVGNDAAILQQQENEHEQEHESYSPSSSAKRERKMPTSSSERLARSHAEDVLALSLELERTKQSLQQECMAHDETRSTLTKARALVVQLEQNVESSQQTISSLQQSHEKELQQAQSQLENLKSQIKAAEEDASLALELARQNSESREQVETWLERALAEICSLREQQSQVYTTTNSNSNEHVETTTTTTSSSKRKQVVRFAESPTICNDDTPPPPPLPPPHPSGMDDSLKSTSPSRQSPSNTTSRSMVAAGRQILNRASGGIVGNDADKRQSRRQELRQRLQALDNATMSGVNGSRAIVAPPPPPPLASGASSKATIAQVLRESLQRLGLSSSSIATTTTTRDDALVETMARHYCQSVESKLQTQTDDIQELQALCEYLENKLVGKSESANVATSLVVSNDNDARNIDSLPENDGKA